MYEYRVVKVNKVTDGDTIDCTVDIGFGWWATFRFRVLGIDTPEKGHPDWKRATDTTKAWVKDHPASSGLLTVRSQKSGPSTTGIGDGAFGRWLGDFWYGEESLREALSEWATDEWKT